MNGLSPLACGDTRSPWVCRARGCADWWVGRAGWSGVPRARRPGGPASSGLARFRCSPRHEPRRRPDARRPRRSARPRGVRLDCPALQAAPAPSRGGRLPRPAYPSRAAEDPSGRAGYDTGRAEPTQHDRAPAADRAWRYQLLAARAVVLVVDLTARVALVEDPARRGSVVPTRRRSLDRSTLGPATAGRRGSQSDQHEHRPQPEPDQHQTTSPSFTRSFTTAEQARCGL